MNFSALLLAIIGIVSPAREATVPLLKPLHREVLAMDAETRAQHLGDDAYRKRMNKVGTEPLAVSVDWSYEPTVKDAHPLAKTRFRIILTPASEPTAAEWYFVYATNGLSIVNLRVGEKYEVEVAALNGRGRPLESAKSTFNTEDAAPRWIAMEGVGNVRDIGGWKTLDGRRVKQGLVYRSQGLNNNADWFVRDPKTNRKVAKPKDQWKPPKERGTPLSRKNVRARLGIKTDLDLRRAENECWTMTGSPLGPSVKWMNIRGTYYDSMNKESSYEYFKKQFSLFLDPVNYPIDFHCIGGADRTGTLCYLLNGLLGVPEDDLDRDYTLTCFASGFTWPSGKDAGCRDAIRKMKEAYAPYPGKTINERIENFVLARGFTKTDIQRFRSIMFGETPVFAPTADTVYAAFRRGSSMQRRQIMQNPQWRKFANDAGMPPKGADDFDAPKWYRAKKIANLRDLGGWRGLDGRRVRTGRIVRCAKLDDVKDPAAEFAALGFKPAVDFDLRKPEDIKKIGGKSPLGIRLINMSAPNYDGFFSKSGRKWFGEAFKIFLDEKNYPIVFHCAKGADRTGTLAFVLNGLLGVDEDDLELDWQATAFYNKNFAFQPVRYDRMMVELHKEKGGNWFEKLVTYAHSCGITDAEIDRFRELMLEPAKAPATEAPRSAAADTTPSLLNAAAVTAGDKNVCLRFGVLSDVHLKADEKADFLLEALADFKRRGAEAIVTCGDLVEDGRIVEYERFAKIWQQAFGAMPGKNGAPELIVIWGNHDCCQASKFRGKQFSPEEQRGFMINGDGPDRVWQLLFGEPFPGNIFLKKIKGVPFVCAHWRHEAELEPWLKAHANEVDLNKLFFVIQHPPSADTVLCVKTGAKNVKRNLSSLPNAFAISGHTHSNFSDDTAFWQGAFTTMTLGTPRGGSPRHDPGSGVYANGSFKAKKAKRPYQHMPTCSVGKVHMGMMVTVADDKVVVERLDFHSRQKVGDDWVVPLPLETHPDAPFVMAEKGTGPEFAADAKVSVCFADGKNAMGESERQLIVEVPQARPVGSSFSRAIVNTFEVLDAETGAVIVKADALQPGHGLPVEESLKCPAECVFAAADIPSGRSFRVRVTPRNAVGKPGKSVDSAVCTNSPTVKP